MKQVEDVYNGLLKKLGVADLKPGAKRDLNQAYKLPKFLASPITLLKDTGEPFLLLSVVESEAHGDKAPVFQVRLANAPEWTVNMDICVLEQLIEALITMESQYEDYCYGKGGVGND